MFIVEIGKHLAMNLVKKNSISETILPPPAMIGESNSTDNITLTEAYILAPGIVLVIVVLCAIVFWLKFSRRKR